MLMELNYKKRGEKQRGGGEERGNEGFMIIIEINFKLHLTLSLWHWTLVVGNLLI